VAQLDRASDFESEGREFESLRARQRPACTARDSGFAASGTVAIGSRIGCARNGYRADGSPLEAAQRPAPWVMNRQTNYILFVSWATPERNPIPTNSFPFDYQRVRVPGGT